LTSSTTASVLDSFVSSAHLVQLALHQIWLCGSESVPCFIATHICRHYTRTKVLTPTLCQSHTE